MTRKPDPAPTNFVPLEPVAMICARSIFAPSTRKALEGVGFISVLNVGVTSIAWIAARQPASYPLSPPFAPIGGIGNAGRRVCGSPVVLQFSAAKVGFAQSGGGTIGAGNARTMNQIPAATPQPIRGAGPKSSAIR